MAASSGWNTDKTLVISFESTNNFATPYILQLEAWCKLLQFEMHRMRYFLFTFSVFILRGVQPGSGQMKYGSVVDTAMTVTEMELLCEGILSWGETSSASNTSSDMN